MIRRLSFRFTILLLAVCMLSGCPGTSDSQKAALLHERSQRAYRESVQAYTRAISAGEDVDRLRYELGDVYLQHGDGVSAVAQLKESRDPRAARLLAIALFRLGDYASAYDLFERNSFSDDEALLYHGMTCEKLNLFDSAQRIFGRISDGQFSAEARRRLEMIERGKTGRDISAVDPDTAARIANAPPADKYPQAGALILMDKTSVELTGDNRMVTTYSGTVKILNDRGKQDYAEMIFGYDTTRQKVELVSARTIKPDGAVVEVGTRHIRDVSKYADFPEYDSVHLYIISFPEVVEGCVIDFSLRIVTSQLMNKKDFTLVNGFQSNDPVMFSRYSLKVPAGRTVGVKPINSEYCPAGIDMKPRASQDASGVSYLWECADVPQFIPEPAMVPYADIASAVAVSSFTSWREYYDWAWPLMRDKISADRDILDMVEELVRLAQTDEEKIRALYHYCAQKIRYVAVEYGEGGFEPRPAALTFRNKYGDCKDKSILLITMLRSAGFEAWPVLIPTRSVMDLREDFPANYFNHCIVAMPYKGAVMFMDPVAETAAWGDLPVMDLGRHVLILKDSGYELAQTPLFDPGHSVQRKAGRLSISQDGIVRGGRTIVSTGSFAQNLRAVCLYMVPDVLRDQIAIELQQFFPGAVLESHEIRNASDLARDVSLRYEFSGSEFWTSAGPLRVLPVLPSISLDAVAKQSRQYPIDLRNVRSEVIEQDIVFPQEYAVKFLPAEVKEDNPWFRVNAGYSRHGATIKYRQEIVWFKTRVEPEQYTDFKRALEVCARDLKQHIVLEKK